MQPSSSTEGGNKVSGELHVENGIVDVRARRSQHDSCTLCTDVGAARRVPPDGVATTISVRLKEEIVDRLVASSSVHSLCGAAGCLKKSRWVIIDGRQPTLSLEHTPVEDGPVVDAVAVGTACREGVPRSSSMHLDNNDGGGGSDVPAAKRTRHRLYRKSLLP